MVEKLIESQREAIERNEVESGLIGLDVEVRLREWRGRGRVESQKWRIRGREELNVCETLQRNLMKKSC